MIGKIRSEKYIFLRERGDFDFEGNSCILCFSVKEETINLEYLISYRVRHPALVSTRPSKVIYALCYLIRVSVHRYSPLVLRGCRNTTTSPYLHPRYNFTSLFNYCKTSTPFSLSIFCSKTSCKFSPLVCTITLQYWLEICFAVSILYLIDDEFNVLA